MLLVLILQTAMGQSGLRIDTSNYYNYQRPGGTINWLRSSDAVPVIIEEIQAAGFSATGIQVGRLMRLDKNTVLSVTVAYQGDMSFGFIYEDGHGIPLRLEDRQFMQDEYKEPFIQPEFTASGEIRYQKVGKLPRQIFLLRERVYWFQHDEKGGAYPVTKEVATRILRQDIRAYIIRMLATRR
jgi:hypothetical protein